ncbi:hypothetical protein LT493_15490 [Streptomyces tricolor]|nr:hypothetical protein [Streptomyces tricolor]
MAAHAALACGERPRLPERRPFADYAAWLAARDTGPAEEHWRRVLAGLGTPTPLPYDRRPAPGATARSGTWLSQRLGAEQTRRLQELARRHRLTPEHAGAGRLGTVAVAVERGTGGAARHHRLRTARRPARRRHRHRPVHHHLCPPGLWSTARPPAPPGCARCRRSGPRTAGTTTRPQRAPRPQPAARRHPAVRQPGGLRELPGRRRDRRRARARPARPGRPGSHQLPLTVVVSPGDRLAVELGYDPRYFDPSTAASWPGSC